MRTDHRELAEGHPANTREFFRAEFSTLPEFQEFQRLHDQLFHKDVVAFPFDKQVEHSMMHVTKIAGLLATICEKKHHGESNEELAFIEKRVADLLVFALKLANLYGIDLEEAYKQRLLNVEQKKLA